MTKVRDLSIHKATSLRRWIGVLCTVLSFGAIASILYGIIPLYQRNADVGGIIDSAFEIFDIAVKPFWYCVLSAGYAALYVVVIVKSLKDTIRILSVRFHWMGSKVDGEMPRQAINYGVLTLNTVLGRMILLMAVSYAMDNYALSPMGRTVLGVLFGGALLTNCLRMFYFKRNLADAVIAPCCAGGMVAVFFLFMFRIFRLEATSLLHQARNIPRMLFGMSERPEGAFLLETLCTNVLFPVLYVTLGIKLLEACKDSVSYSVKNASFSANARKLAIRYLIFLGVILLAQLVAEGQAQPEMLPVVIKTHLELILLLVTVLLLSKCHGPEAADAPIINGVPRASAPSQDTSGQSAESRQAAERTSAEEERAARPVEGTAHTPVRPRPIPTPPPDRTPLWAIEEDEDEEPREEPYDPSDNTTKIHRTGKGSNSLELPVGFGDEDLESKESND